MTEENKKIFDAIFAGFMAPPPPKKEEEKGEKDDITCETY